VSHPCRLGGSNRRFDLRHISPIRLNALEQVPITVKGHADGSVAHDSLQSLGGPARVLDEQACGSMSQHVETVALFASIIGQAAVDLSRDQAK